MRHTARLDARAHARLAAGRQPLGCQRKALHSSFPIVRSTAVVRDSEDADGVLRFEIDHVVRETLYRSASYRKVWGHARHARAGSGKADDLAECRVDCIEEFCTESTPVLFIPSSGGAVLGVGLVLETNRRTHRFRNSASARRRTSSQGMPDDSPASTRRARLSISAAHAVSRSARSVRGSSKLESSSAATSARSSTDHPRASRRNSCAREGMR